MSDPKPTADYNHQDRPDRSFGPGTMVDGYRILSTLGEGGFGARTSDASMSVLGGWEVQGWPAPTQLQSDLRGRAT